MPEGAINREELELLAMFAGSTMQTLQSMNVTNLPPAKALVNEALKGAQVVGVPSAPRPQQVPPQVHVAGVVETPTPAPTTGPVPSQQQFELDLFRKMDMTDVYKILSRIEEMLEKVVKQNKQILERVSILDNINDT
jgi:hypothetical protein